MMISKTTHNELDLCRAGTLSLHSYVCMHVSLLTI